MEYMGHESRDLTGELEGSSLGGGVGEGKYSALMHKNATMKCITLSTNLNKYTAGEDVKEMAFLFERGHSKASLSK